ALARRPRRPQLGQESRRRHAARGCARAHGSEAARPRAGDRGDQDRLGGPRGPMGACDNRRMQRVLSPVLVGRQEELSQLEDALLSANASDGRFGLLAGEAGIGKTRLANELTRRARKLGCTALWGSCSEAELSLPYLPFVEAIGNQLGEHDLAQV